MIGAGADWQAMDALKLSGSYLYINNEGTATFAAQNNAATSPCRFPSTTSTTASSNTST